MRTSSCCWHLTPCLCPHTLPLPWHLTPCLCPADLIKHIHPFPPVLEVDFLKASSYGLATNTSGQVKLDEAFDDRVVRGKHVLIVRGGRGTRGSGRSAGRHMIHKWQRQSRGRHPHYVMDLGMWLMAKRGHVAYGWVGTCG